MSNIIFFIYKCNCLCCSWLQVKSVKYKFQCYLNSIGQNSLSFEDKQTKFHFLNILFNQCIIRVLLFLSLFLAWIIALMHLYFLIILEKKFMVVRLYLQNNMTVDIIVIPNIIKYFLNSKQTVTGTDKGNLCIFYKKKTLSRFLCLFFF